ncbi:MAG: glycosyltransferase family 39 protein [Chloroflexota bacterium]
MLLALFATRLHSLTTLPLHNDEGLHLTRAVEVWNLHPFWNITDGKIINHWPIAALYPQNVPDFVARVPTVFIAVIGLAGGYALVRRWCGRTAALWASLFWVTSPYLFFYERLAQSDAEAGALAVVALLAALRLARTGHARDAVLTGLFISLAALMKLTAAPYALTLTGIVLAFGSVPVVERVRNLLLIGLTGVSMFAVPVAYLSLRGNSFFGIAMGWVGSGTHGANDGWQSNFATLAAQLTDFGFLAAVWPVALAGGLLLLCWHGRSFALRLVTLTVLPIAIVIATSSTIFPRHYVAVIMPLILLAGAGWGLLMETLSRRYRIGLSTTLLTALTASAIPVMWAAYHNPATLPAPATVRLEYIETHSAGTGLREAVIDLPTYVPADEIVIASMFPASCRRANFYAEPDYTLHCTDAPGRDTIQAELNEKGEAYVLVEASPLLGIDVTTLEVQANLLAHYPRPGGISSVDLYHLTTD